MDRKEADLRCMQVWHINCYALFMGYLLMAVRGLGFLVIMWSTVVLLGGFVSDLEKKDFWSLTIITLVLTPRVSADVSLKEKLTYIGHAISGLWRATFATLNPNETEDHWLLQQLARVVWLCHLLVAPVVVCPLAALYVCGPLFSGGISVWRLIAHDYVDPMKEEAAHLKPALIVLYSLAMLQGLLFCYRFYSRFARKDLVHEVAKAYGMAGNKLVEGYLSETVTRCEKDPSFFKETNLATYAVGMIESQSYESFLLGARILDTLLGQNPTADHIGLVASSSHALVKLLQALDSTCPHGQTMRELAASIVAHLAGRMPLMQFPQVIKHIGSLLDISRQQFAEDRVPSAEIHKKLVENGFDILHKLAIDEDNCRAISNTEGLLSKVMAPVSSNLLHLIDHDTWWSKIIAVSLQVMCRLVSATGETGTQLCCQISSNKEAIHNMVEILKCRGCGEKLHILTMEILTQLPMDEESLSGVNKEIRGNFFKMLPFIFIDTNTTATDNKEVRKLAGEALVKLSKSGSNAAIILKANDNVVRGLRNIILEDDNTNRIIAAKILKHLYIHYNKNDGYLKTLKETMEELMPKVLPDILCPFGSKGRETQAEHGTNKRATDIEAPEEVVPQDDGHHNNTPSHEQNEAKKLQASLLSLVAAIFEKLISQDHDLAQLVHKISPGDSATSFANKLKEMVLVPTNSQPTVSCLRIMRNTSKMVISMIKHNDNDLKENLVSFQDFIRSLSTACNRMSCLEGSLILYNTNRGAVKRYTTLASLLKNAQELLDQKEPQAM